MSMMGSNSKAAGSHSHCSSASIDIWSEILATETLSPHQHQQINVVYRKRNPPRNNSKHSDPAWPPPSRVSLADPNKRVSWNRSLSTRGRTSIAVGACMVYQPQLKQDKNKGRPALPKGKHVKPLNFEKEKQYFQEVDAFELLEESPSPKKVGTWTIPEEAPLPAVCARLERWLHSRRLKPSCGPSSTLSKIMDTPATGSQITHDVGINSAILETLERTVAKNSHLDTIQAGGKRGLLDGIPLEGTLDLQIDHNMMIDESDGGCEDIDLAVKKLSLTSTSSSLDDGHISPFSALLSICGQSAPSLLGDVLSCYSETIVKIGEGTYGEAFKVGGYVCKIVPFDGDFRVNGEIQKRSEELLEEVLLCKTLNQLRGNEGDSDNLCRTFIQSLEFKVCQGPYDATLIQAWEAWDEKRGSENDHPKDFPEKQCYVVFVQEHGGKDLESFVLLNYEEARTLLVQAIAGLAVAESAYEFEHRDLHWGNILVSRSDSVTLQFTLDGKDMFVKTFGLLISIIDFTLSRINTGDRILYLDLSSDPDLFKGPKGDKQSETYRRMREVTEDCWEGSFPRTNVLWVLYLVDILLLKKSFERTPRDERELRSLKKRLERYNSAKEAILDPFFNDLFVEQCNK
ncbi:serine/threonine-protein kinase haspin homolog [Arachis hypogaea]|uniref:non-specific serine/threonine protein kinase n=1 Tax=Arachis hypogaea TaxID=3818 RepID=A0A445CN52_ARAHY|nr:serine/threonine-protein kinase haspin homolog [Arachis hypogaea]RYR52354.1 hypothetical protein Ahy_A06g027286 [Arachis hypogaea]